MSKFCLLSLVALIFFTYSCATVNTADTERYAFSRQFEKGSDLSPRGGTTLGAEVTLDTNTSKEWIMLQEKGLSKKERDRRAILAMAGDYRTSFEFIETVPFVNDYSMDRPYRSWATERIYVLEETEDFISLQHILVMFFVKEGKVLGPVIVKHWRQDWTYEPEQFHEYAGNNTWVKKTVPFGEAKGSWLQEVSQVDDSPRYASLGKWEHTNVFSQWSGSKTYRPLPRREFSIRSDYNVLDSVNRLIVLPTGWVHEQENMKLILSIDGKKEYLAKEIGLNRYERITEFDFSGGDQYLEKTGDYWEAVREVWSSIYENNDKFVFIPKVKDQKLINKQFAFADNYEGNLSSYEIKRHAEKIIAPHIKKD